LSAGEVLAVEDDSFGFFEIQRNMHPLRAGILLLRIRSEPNAAEIDRPMLDGLAEKSSDSALPQVRFHIDTFKKGDRRSAAAIHVIVAQSRFGKAHGGMRR
jgi:hypothetical protein